ncbi:MAG: hypothetical protein PHC75_00150 [Burkholderiales bacterium]|nr:hypothetical protein [Burkholderiales bacterium]
MINISGKNNKIIIISESGEKSLLNSEIPNLNLEIKGNNNYLVIELPINFLDGTTIKILNDNTHVEIASSPYMKLMLRCSYGDGQICKIQKNTVMVDVAIYLEGKTELYIGQDCLFSYGPIYIRPCDGHSIIDLHTNDLLNKPNAPITIGDHCWISCGCQIIRGTSLPNNTIVGAGAIVNKKFTEEYTVIAGIPAKIINRNSKMGYKKPL